MAWERPDFKTLEQNVATVEEVVAKSLEADLERLKQISSIFDKLAERNEQSGVEADPSSRPGI